MANIDDVVKEVTGEYVVYCYTSPSGKKYIGQTKSLKHRIAVHKKSTKCRVFFSAITKYGYDNFILTVLEDCLTLEQANIREGYHIAVNDTLVPNGYNIRTGGENSRHSEETKEKLRIINTGKKHTPEAVIKIKEALKSRKPPSSETREKLSRAGKLKVMSEDQKKKLSVAMTGKSMPEKTRLAIAASLKNRVYTDESRAKISVAHKGKTVSEETKEKLRNRVVSVETREKLSIAARNMSKETRAKMSLAQKNKAAITEETRQKLSIAAKGRVVSDETKKKISNSKTGSTLSQETRNKLSIANKGKSIPASVRQKISDSSKGRVVSDETREKLSKAGKGRVVTDQQRKAVTESNRRRGEAKRLEKIKSLGMLGVGNG